MFQPQRFGYDPCGYRKRNLYGDHGWAIRNAAAIEICLEP